MALVSQSLRDLKQGPGMDSGLRRNDGVGVTVHFHSTIESGQPCPNEVKSCSLDEYGGAGRDSFEDRRVAVHSPDYGDGAGGTNFVASAHGSRAKEHAEGAAGRPVAQVSELDDLLSHFFACRDGDAEVYLVSPGAGRRLDGQGVPNSGCGVCVVEGGVTVTEPAVILIARSLTSVDLLSRVLSGPYNVQVTYYRRSCVLRK